MTDTVTRIGIIGCMGRMGQAILTRVQSDPDAVFSAGSEIASHPLVGAAVPDTDILVAKTAEAVFHSADVVIDFTPPGQTAAHATLAAEIGTPYVVGTTGLAAGDHMALSVAGEKVAVIQAGNFSLGINMLMALVREAAAKLDSSWDIDIVEMHHKHKVDAPSGTALMLGEAAAEGRGKPLEELRTPAREGITGARVDGSIGFAALRGGAVIGEHEVIFASESERLVLSHKAENRGLFADGAVKAALWLVHQAPARYSMSDMFRA